ncbi:MAG TPA: hypothetical protein VHA56_12075 [Mucilaginibacter sp.]|nr:hypothetical protein [Mucilaginibacter sp.]
MALTFVFAAGTAFISQKATAGVNDDCAVSQCVSNPDDICCSDFVNGQPTTPEQGTLIR